jgi:hypothetical protein
MKIHSNFHDYYDGAFGSIDPTFHWTRKTETIRKDDNITKNFIFPNNKYRVSTGQISAYYHFAYIFFCGTIYCAMKKDDVWYYGEEADRNYVREVLDYAKTAEKFFYNHGRDCQQINLFHNSPIIAYTRESIYQLDKSISRGIFKNVPLNFYNFQKAVDPYQARQKIEIFLRNDLVFEPSIKSVSDKIKVLAHGMDPVWSFRNPDPPKRKRKV